MKCIFRNLGKENGYGIRMVVPTEKSNKEIINFLREHCGVNDKSVVSFPCPQKTMKTLLDKYGFMCSNIDIWCLGDKNYGIIGFDFVGLNYNMQLGKLFVDSNITVSINDKTLNFDDEVNLVSFIELYIKAATDIKFNKVM